MMKVIHSWRAERQGNNVDNRIFHSMLCYGLLKIVAFILKLYVTIMLLSNFCAVKSPHQ